MTGRVWTLGAAASVAVHAAGLATLALVVRAAPPPDQPMPETRFSVEAADVTRSRATPTTPTGDAAQQSDAQAPRARQGRVALSTATETPAMTTAAQSLPAPAQPAIAAPPPPPTAATAMQAAQVLSAAPAVIPLQETTPAKSVALRPSNAPATALAAGIAPIARIDSLSAPVNTVSPVTVPVERTGAVQIPQAAVVEAAPTAFAVKARIASADVLVARAPPASIAASPALSSTAAAAVQGVASAMNTLALSAEPAPAAAPQAEIAIALPPPAEAGKAALAWSGDTASTLPAASLAAIAAFTQQGDLSAEAMQVRDGIEGVLASVPCARLQTTFNAETGQLELRGHIPENGLRAPVVAALRAVVGDAITLSDELLILPRPQCGALAGIADLGLPQSTEQLDNPAVIGEDGFARNTLFHGGDDFYLELVAADYDSYLYVDYFVADGSVIHLQPNRIVPARPVPAKTEVTVARSTAENPALTLTVAPPYGQEIAAAFAASVPLYEGVRPLQEPAGPYLAFMKEQIARTRATHPDFKGEWVYFFITTRE